MDELHKKEKAEKMEKERLLKTEFMQMLKEDSCKLYGLVVIVLWA